MFLKIHSGSLEHLKATTILYYIIRTAIYALDYTRTSWFPIENHLAGGFIRACFRCKLAAKWLTNVGILKTLHSVRWNPWRPFGVSDNGKRYIISAHMNLNCVEFYFQFENGHDLRELSVDWHFHTVSAWIFLSCRLFRYKTFRYKSFRYKSFRYKSFPHKLVPMQSLVATKWILLPGSSPVSTMASEGKSWLRLNWHPRYIGLFIRECWLV